MNPVSNNQFMTVFFSLLLTTIASCNKIALLLKGEPVTLSGLLKGAWPSLVFMLIYGFAWLREKD